MLHSAVSATNPCQTLHTERNPPDSLTIDQKLKAHVRCTHTNTSVQTVLMFLCIYDCVEVHVCWCVCMCVQYVHVVLTRPAVSPASTGTWHDWTLLPLHSAPSWG